MLFSPRIQGDNGASVVNEHSVMSVVIHRHLLVITKIFNSLGPTAALGFTLGCWTVWRWDAGGGAGVAEWSCGRVGGL